MKKSKLITMAISLLAAICLWIYVVTVVNPEGTTTISNIPVTFSGAEVLREDQGLVLSGDYQDMVTVSFTGKNSDMKKLEQNKEEISAVVDVSKIRSTRDYTLSYDLLLPDAVHGLGGHHHRPDAGQHHGACGKACEKAGSGEGRFLAGRGRRRVHARQYDV